MAFSTSLGQPVFSDYTSIVHATFHRFLLMLLMLALPLQGFAATSMLGCQSQQAVTEPMAMASCHEPEPSDAPPARHDCSNCAACGLATALLIPLCDIPALGVVSTRYVPHHAPSFSGFIPDSPERPPRRLLA